MFRILLTDTRDIVRWEQSPNNDKVMRLLWSSHSPSSMVSAPNHELQTTATHEKMLYSVHALWRPHSLWTPYSTLFKKQKVIFVPLELSATSPKFLSSYKEILLCQSSLQRNPANQLDPCVTHSWVVLAQGSGHQLLIIWVSSTKSSH